MSVTLLHVDLPNCISIPQNNLNDLHWLFSRSLIIPSLSGTWNATLDYLRASIINFHHIIHLVPFIVLCEWDLRIMPLSDIKFYQMSTKFTWNEANNNYYRFAVDRLSLNGRRTVLERLFAAGGHQSLLWRAATGPTRSRHRDVIKLLTWPTMLKNVRLIQAMIHVITQVMLV